MVDDSDGILMRRIERTYRNTEMLAIVYGGAILLFCAWLEWVTR